MQIDETRGRRMLFSAWIAVMGVIIWQEVKVNHRAPEPSKLTGASVAMAMLDLAAPTIGWPVAGVMGLGLAIGLSLMRIAKASPGPQQPGTTSTIGSGGGPASGLFTIPPTPNNPQGIPTTSPPVTHPTGTPAPPSGTSTGGFGGIPGLPGTGGLGLPGETP